MPWRRPWRFFRHLVTDRGTARRRFPDAALDRVEIAVADGERVHRGQVRFVVEPALPLARVLAGLPPRERALEVFGLLGVWDTEENCGVLVYVLLADRDVEIVADRGIHRAVGTEAWEQACRTMEAAFREGRFGDGAEAGVRAINALLTRHYPKTADAAGEDANELPDRPLVL